MSDREPGEIAGVEGGERGEEEAGFSGRVDRKSGVCAEEGVGREDGEMAGVDGGERGEEGAGFCRGREMV